MNVYQKLQQARIKLQSSAIKKSGDNKFVGYSYFELADFLPQTQSLFAELGLCAGFSIEGGRAFLRIYNSEKPDEYVFFETPVAEAPMKGTLAIQQLGAVHTYLRRYLYVNAMEIVEHDAVDAAKPLAPSGSATRVVQDAFMAMGEEEQTFLRGEAEEVRLSMAANDMPAVLLRLGKLDGEEKAAIWCLFSSAERATIKRASKGE
jgi:hypothetical protein